MKNPIPLGKRTINAFGGPVKMSRATGWPISTIESWKSKGSIPRWRLRDIRSAAQANRVTLPGDFPTVETEGDYGKAQKRHQPLRRRSGAREDPRDTATAMPDRRLISYVTKTGDNFALLMSPMIVEQAGLSEGSRVEIEPVDDGRLLVSRSKRHFTLDELLAGMTPEREHSLEDDAPRGEETL